MADLRFGKWAEHEIAPNILTYIHKKEVLPRAWINLRVCKLIYSFHAKMRREWLGMVILIIYMCTHTHTICVCVMGHIVTRKILWVVGDGKVDSIYINRIIILARSSIKEKFPFFTTLSTHTYYNAWNLINNACIHFIN